MRVGFLVVAATVLGGLSIAGCTPSLQGNGENGVTIHQVQLRPGSESDVAEMAANYCSQFGRSEHIAREDIGWLWSDTFTFDCVN